LVERNAGPPCKVGEIVDSQVQTPLKQLGVSGSLLGSRPLRSAGTASVWGSGVAERSAALDPYGGGYYVDRARFETALLEAAVVARATVRCGCADRTVQRRTAGWDVEVECDSGPRRIRAALIVEANGRGRPLAGSEGRSRRDMLVALIAYLPEVGGPPDLRFLIEAAPDGWWYSSTLPGGQRVLAFMTDADLLPRGRAEQGRYFLQRYVETTFVSEQIGVLNPRTAPHAVPAMSTLRNRIHGEGWVAVGDAAASYDPLLGLGVSAALAKGLGLGTLLASDPTLAGGIYAEAERETFAHYVRTKTTIYRRVGRWACEPFWSRRQ